jgi:hypothetical protein
MTIRLQDAMPVARPVSLASRSGGKPRPDPSRNWGRDFLCGAGTRGKVERAIFYASVLFSEPLR